MGLRSEDGRRRRGSTTTAREGGACGGEEMMGAGRKKRREGRAAICDTVAERVTSHTSGLSEGGFDARSEVSQQA
jgi:hypothetical protein